eukprot:scaffold9176_cov129-Cylindrotheca_fusiformis.AAC.22
MTGLVSTFYKYVSTYSTIYVIDSMLRGNGGRYESKWSSEPAWRACHLEDSACNPEGLPGTASTTVLGSRTDRFIGLFVWNTCFARQCTEGPLQYSPRDKYVEGVWHGSAGTLELGNEFMGLGTEIFAVPSEDRKVLKPGRVGGFFCRQFNDSVAKRLMLKPSSSLEIFVRLLQGKRVQKWDLRLFRPRGSTAVHPLPSDSRVSSHACTEQFQAAQGYDVHHTSEYFQDNQSAMKMEKNGRQSAGQKSRHINIRYFFIKDCIDSGEINLLYCPTGEMLGDDFFTSKPQQGSLFRRFQDVIMGIAHHKEIRATKAPNQERVEIEIWRPKSPHIFVAAENQNVMSEAASEMVVTVPKQTKPQGVTWATIVRWPKTAGRDHPLSPSGQMFKLEKRRT